MTGLDRIFLLNAAGFDEVEFPVGGHSQVIGVNGHGKSTLLRTVLFFYLGSNDKTAYALHETKSDFVSHYLGQSPSYLIYQVSRGDGHPAFHIAVTRPGARIQFHFIDAPYRREYYVNGNLVRSIEGVHDMLREAECVFDTVHSYQDFQYRIFGLVRSPYAAFKPSSKSMGQTGILPRIISGIFTVTQLDADKLKSSLTCGIKQESANTEIDLASLKNQLENFRRVNRAVKTYIAHEPEAVSLVQLAADYETAKAERIYIIEQLVKMAKCLSRESALLNEQKSILETERNESIAVYEQENKELAEAIQSLSNEIAVVDEKIRGFAVWSG